MLPVIVIAQLCCTSLWFACNGVINELIQNFGLNEMALGHLTSSVQFGFIIGTLIFAILSIADRYSPSKVFFYCALLGSLFNIAIIWSGNTIYSILVFRFFTGFFLAGIYPVGMKIASDYYDAGLGKSLGFLVGALVLGTAFPHLLKETIGEHPWEYVFISTSIIAAVGGIMMRLLIPDGPFRKPSLKINLSGVRDVFRKDDFRTAAFGYFGHMWELYTFWAFVPIMLSMFQNNNLGTDLNIPLLSFLIIGIGGIACVLAGYLAQSTSNKHIAYTALLLSGCCCILFPFVFALKSVSIFILFLFFWAMVVIADSPLFSTLVAHSAPVELKATALTIVNCIGFFITILSIQLINGLFQQTESIYLFCILAIGPAFGLLMHLRHKTN